MAKAISTYQTYLMIKKSGETYEKLIDIISFPDLGQAPETIDTTTLSDPMQTFMPGIEGNDNMTFESNYTKEAYDSVQTLNDGEEHDLAVWFGATGKGTAAVPDGSKGKFGFKGYIRPQISGGGVNERVQMNVIVTPSTPIEPVA